jgi:hypothetical protein
MKTVKCLLFCICVLAQTVFALDNKHNHTLTLTIINNTTETLSFAGVKDMNPSNAFTMTPTEILPGGAATVTGTTTPYYDMAGQLRLKDNSGNVNLLYIENYRHINYEQPHFSMHNNNYISFTESKTFNRDENANVLMLNAARVVIQNKA